MHCARRSATRRQRRALGGHRHRWLIASLAMCLSACGSLNSARMMSPGSFGMEQVHGFLWVEPSMSTDQRLELQRQIQLGRAQVERFFGSVTTAPYFVACISNECAVRFGSYGARASAFGDSAIRLSPNGLAAALVAHEWTHAEVYRRVGGWRHIGKLPRWFDEGLAVVVADEPRHSEDNWREIGRRGLATPKLQELLTRSDWTEAVVRYGEPKDDPDNLRLVYSTAGHEVRTWLACAGQGALLELLAAVRAGEPMDAAYQRLGRRCGR